MNRLISVYTGSGFFGRQYFRTPELFEESGIEPLTAKVDDFTVDSLEDLAERHPEGEVDGILLHKQRAVKKFIESGLYSDTALFFGGHVIPRDSGRWNEWEETVESGRDIFVFAGSVRAARVFHIPEQENLRVVITPIMGRNVGESYKIPNNFTQFPEKEYDIGFFSSQSFNKRPHRVLETANNVAKELGRELRVWIGGRERNDSYNTLLDTVVESGHYDHLDIEHNSHMPTQRLFDTVQQTRVMYLPLVKPGETTCYSAWEVVSYDIPLVGTDWAGIGEAVQHARHPLSTRVPMKRVTSMEDIFPDSVRDAWPELVQGVIEENERTPFTIDETAAQRALINALETDVTHPRKFHIPERVRGETTIKAFADALNGVFDPGEEIPDDLIDAASMNVVKTTRGYSLHRETDTGDPFLQQTSPYFPPTE